MKKRFQGFSLLAATFIGTMDSNALIPIIALYSVSLGASLELTGLIVAMYSIVHVPANIVLGRLVDKIGLRKPFMLGLSLDAISMLLYSVAANPTQLLLVRMFHGLGGGFVGPSSMAIASRMAPEDKKGRMMAKYGIAIALSVIAGFAIGGVLIDRFGYNIFFYVLTALLLSSIGFASIVREPEGFEAVKSTFMQDLKHLGTLLKQKIVLASYSSIFGLYYLTGAFTVLVPLYLKNFGLAEIDVILAFTTFAIMSVIMHYPAGILSDRIGPRLPAIFGLVAVILAMLMIPFFDTMTSLLPVIALYGIGHGLIFPSSSTMVVRGTKDDVRGLASGVFYGLLVAGVAIGAPIAGLVASVTSYDIGMQSATIVPIMSLLLLIGLLRSKKSAR